MSLKYMQVKNLTETSAELYLYGDIVGSEWDKWADTDTCPQDVLDTLKVADGKNLDIYINSGGGSVFAGLAIYNMLNRHQGTKTVHIDGVAASIASVIAMAGDKLMMPSNAFLMIHNPWNVAMGNAKDFRKAADDLDIIRNGITEVYKSKLLDGVEIETIENLMNDETWLTADQAKEYFNIEISQANKAVAKLDIKNSAYKNIPQDLITTQGQPNNQKELLQIELDLLNV